MTAGPSQRSTDRAPAHEAAADAAPRATGALDFGLEGEGLAAFTGWRRNALVAAAAAGCLGLFSFARWFSPHAPGALFWPLAGVALLLYLLAAVQVLARRRLSHALFAALALCQAGNLLLIAMEVTRGLALPPVSLTAELPLRAALDLCTGAAAIHLCALYPTRLPRASAIGAAAWLGAALALWALQLAPAPFIWWWTQLAYIVMLAAARFVIDESYRYQPNPYAGVGRRLASLALAALVSVTLAVAVASGGLQASPAVATVAAVAWTLFASALLLLAPLLVRGHPALREFALLAGISTVATSLDLLLVALFSLGPFSAFTLALFIAAGLYAGARQPILNHLIGSQVLATERTFEHIFRAARQVQTQPSSYPQTLGRLLEEVFEPSELRRVSLVLAKSRVVSGGTSLVVPLRASDGGGAGAAALALRFAQHGQRLFTFDDARLADRVVEQLRRAVAFDKAVEQGRLEERQRIAQDLHDDIGARLLTLMYRAPTPEMEDYIRLTLQDLKTLTRGLAATEHRLSHAAAEWKTDISQRLAVAQAQLAWSCDHDRDLRLSVVQWSALTRLLRELVSNALYHGHATRVEVSLAIEGRRLRVRVADDGSGRDPPSWAQGLGMGGVRKRVKLLGGSVQWRENAPRGIVCDVQVDDFAERGRSAAST